MIFKYKIILLLIPLFIFTAVFSENPPSAQTMGGLTRQEEAVQKEGYLRDKIAEEKAALPGVVFQEISFPDSGVEALVKEIVVQGVTLLTAGEIERVISSFHGRKLSLTDMQNVVVLLTAIYRRKGYVTSFAYLPAQTIKDGVLKIIVVEGRLGELKIQGNRYVKTSALEKKIKLEPRGYFDYSALQRSLIYINEHPDRLARAVLVPGKEPGTTDIVIEVQDRWPVHLGFEYDNFGSRYIEKDRFALVGEHNNLLGFDDQILIKFQRSESDFYQFRNATYLFPLGETAVAGAHFSRSKLKLGREFTDVDARGRAALAGIFLHKTLVTRANFNLRCNFGFDYKHLKNFLSGALSSKDELRVFKNGFDLDVNDPAGRTLIVSELAVGAPRMFGALASKDDICSRAGAGGKFFKGVFNVFRLQKMPFSSVVLLKTSGQYTNYSLPAAEQFQLGGAASVRGYPPAEHSGDKGVFMSGEWSLPSYFFPEDIKAPYTKHSLFSALRFVVFYDWATVHLNKVLAGDKKHQTLKGYGFGARFNVNDNIFVRLEFGYPLGKTPSDDEHLHPCIGVNWKF